MRTGEEWYFTDLMTNISERRSEFRTLTKRAYTDPVTGLASRQAFEERFQAVLHGEHLNPAALLLIDLDGFKIINDRYGHDVGANTRRPWVSSGGGEPRRFVYWVGAVLLFADLPLALPEAGLEGCGGFPS